MHPSTAPALRCNYLLENRPFFTQVYHSWLDKFRPHSLEYLLKTRLNVVQYTLPILHNRIDLDSLYPWDQLSSQSQLSCRLVQRPYPNSSNPRVSSASVEGLSTLFQEHTNHAFSCDIKDVDGLSSSKSPLHDFASMEQFALACCAKEIGPGTPEQFSVAIAHKGIRHIHNSGFKQLYCFYRHAWDERLFMPNEDGSHHFAAAQHLARKFGIDYELQAPLRTVRLNVSALNDLERRFHMYVISDDALGAMRSAVTVGYGVEYYEQSLPLPRLSEFSGQNIVKPIAILIPISSKKADAVARLLQEHGITNLASVLSKMFFKQHQLDDRGHPA